MKRLILMTTLAAVGAFAQTAATGTAQPTQGSTPAKPVVKKHKKSKKPAATNPTGSGAAAPVVKK